MKASLLSAELGTVLAEYETGPISRETLKLYAQASGDLNPLHLDTGFAQKAGFDDVIVHGMLAMALLGRLLTGHFEAADLRHFSARFTGIIPVGTSLLCRARLAARDTDSALLELDGLNPAGASVITGTARLALPS